MKNAVGVGRDLTTTRRMPRCIRTGETKSVMRSNSDVTVGVIQLISGRFGAAIADVSQLVWYRLCGSLLSILVIMTMGCLDISNFLGPRGWLAFQVLLHPAFAHLLTGINVGG